MVRAWMFNAAFVMYVILVPGLSQADAILGAVSDSTHDAPAEAAEASLEDAVGADDSGNSAPPEQQPEYEYDDTDSMGLEEGDFGVVAAQYGMSCGLSLVSLLAWMIPYLNCVTGPLACLGVPAIIGLGVKMIGDSMLGVETSMVPPVVGAYLGGCVVMPGCQLAGTGISYALIVAGLFGAVGLSAALGDLGTAAGMAAFAATYGAVVIFPLVGLAVGAAIGAAVPVAAYYFYGLPEALEQAELDDDAY